MHHLPDHPGAESPFDAIKQTREDGTEFWSARGLQPMLDYPTWQHFKPVIERAMTACSNQGIDPNAHFTVNRETPRTGGPAREDYQLTRFAAYLVAMNGDPRKAPVAHGQAYFAVKTREVGARHPRVAARDRREGGERSHQRDPQPLQRRRGQARRKWQRMIDVEKLLTPDDLAVIFGVPRRRIVEWNHDRGWPCVRVGRIIRWTPEQVEQIKALQSVKANRSPSDPRTPLSAKRSRRA